MGADPRERRSLDHSLERLEEALAHSRVAGELAAAPRPARLTPRTTASLARPLGVPLALVLLLVLVWMGLTMGLAFLIPALFAGLWLVAQLARGSAPATAVAAGSSTPRVGMGATVASDAVLGEGCVIEMGATVGAGAVLERGAVVRMGASIGPRAVLEEGAAVSWGASVGAGAVIGAGAVVSAGSDVAAGAQVPAHAQLPPGSTWTAGSRGHRLPASPRPRAQDAPADPRAEQLRVACDRLEQEFARAPERVQAMFGDARATSTSLRRTCLDLLARERALRAEAAPEALARLDQEKAAIEARLALAGDAQVRGSLAGAVAAITAQQEQRKLLQTRADRLEAELTRLLWTVDGMGTELVRVRTAGAELYQGSTGELARSVEQLKDEIDHIAQALEEVTSSERASHDVPTSAG